MEEAATPLPSEETTPPVTNIYFGAIRVVRASTTPALDCSYLSGLLSEASHRFQVCLANLSTMTTYTQLWARDAALSIATLSVDKCKFLMLAETFSAQKGSKSRKDLSEPRFVEPLTVATHGYYSRGTAAAPRPSKLGKSPCRFVLFCFAGPRFLARDEFQDDVARLRSRS